MASNLRVYSFNNPLVYLTLYRVVAFSPSATYDICKRNISCASMSSVYIRNLIATVLSGENFIEFCHSWLYSIPIINIALPDFHLFMYQYDASTRIFFVSKNTDRIPEIHMYLYFISGVTGEYSFYFFDRVSTGTSGRVCMYSFYWFALDFYGLLAYCHLTSRTISDSTRWI